LVLHSSGGA